MQPFEIYNATFSWRGCDDTRPWLIIDVRSNGSYGCFPIASECYEGSCFPLSKSHPDFAATGLKKDCHILDARIYDLPASSFERRRGALVGELLGEFRRFSGV
jgi:hypothetical protein